MCRGIIRRFSIDVVDSVGAVERDIGPHLCGDSLGNILAIETVGCGVQHGHVSIIVELV